MRFSMVCRTKPLKIEGACILDYPMSLVASLLFILPLSSSCRLLSESRGRLALTVARFVWRFPPSLLSLAAPALPVGATVTCGRCASLANRYYTKRELHVKKILSATARAIKKPSEEGEGEKICG